MTKLGGKIKEILKNRRWKIKVKTWALLVFLAPLLFIDATLLRFDHIKMTELRDVVLEADVEEDDAKLAAALTDLKEYVFHNIVVNVVEENGVQTVQFGTGPFYLEHQYLRAANVALSEAEAKLTGDNNPNGNIYGMAGETCAAEAAVNGWTWDSPGYINCMVTEIGKYPASDELQSTIVASLPSTELYRRNYASPVWAPTLTGFMLIITLIVILIIVKRFLVWLVLRIALKFV
ncbi:hypothetical protein IJ135_01545 [Candidatus Saccharibacteria bacterium]|nr:hypothetical protein [Candidatus Saccharibacteria bacterium]